MREFENGNKITEFRAYHQERESRQRRNSGHSLRGAGLEMWVSINQSGKMLKKWVLRYTDAAGKRQKVRIGSYPEMTLAKAQAAAEDLDSVYTSSS